MFYSSGDGADDAKERVGRYFSQVDSGLREVLGGERAPLILAGVDYLLPIYREANTYAHLVDEGIPGNPDHANPAALHRQACAILRPYFRRKLQDALAQHRQLQGTGRTADKTRLIVPAAYRARVAVLFVASRGRQWGRFDPASNFVQLRLAEWKPGDDDLMDLAAHHTLLIGGTAYVLEPSDMPEAAPLAATFRY
jgi:hypothetical protein